MVERAKLKKYAELTVRSGLNIQEGQILAINAHLESAAFTRELVREAYKQGAKRVHVDWGDTETQRIHFEEMPEESLKEFPKWRKEMFQELVNNNGAILQLTGTDPSGLAGVDPSRIQLAQQAAGKELKFFQAAQLKGDINWCIIGVPTEKWAKQVFPEVTTEEAVENLWEKIFETVRLDQEDPVLAWEEHAENLHAKINYLNEKHFKTLHYKAPGTDLSIELHPDHLWLGAGDKSTSGVTFLPNMPTEEVFTAPKSTGVNGKVTSTKPLALHGNLIENFSFTFKDGKVIDFTAEKGYDTLKAMLETDENAKYLGEVALVPDASPISQSGITFFNTLYDENASCHIALGNAITTNIKDGGTLSEEELKASGANQSMVHTDFMIGSPSLDIDAETHDGECIALFRNGNWAI